MKTIRKPLRYADTVDAPRVSVVEIEDERTRSPIPAPSPTPTDARAFNNLSDLFEVDFEI